MCLMKRLSEMFNLEIFCLCEGSRTSVCLFVLHFGFSLTPQDCFPVSPPTPFHLGSLKSLLVRLIPTQTRLMLRLLPQNESRCGLSRL